MLASRLELGDAKTLLNLADMYRYLHIPYKAAQLLQKGIEDGVVVSDFDNQQRLADGWLAAREPELAAAVLQKMLALDDSGATHLKLGQILVAMEAWDKAVSPLKESADKLGGEQKGLAMLLLGTSYFHLGQLEQAKTEFSKAIAYDAQSRQAGQWLRHIEDKLEKKNDA